MFKKAQKQKGIGQVFDSRIMTAILLLVLFFLGRSVYDRFVIEQDMADRRMQAEAELAELQERHDSLKTEVEYLSNERGIEAEMRRNFDMAREGEQVVIILDEEDEGVVAGASTTTSETAPWYRFWE